MRAPAFVLALAAAMLAVTLTGADARAQEVLPGAANPIQALDDCVSANAARLEISGEGADIVAQAAVARCGRELTAASQASPAGGLFRPGGSAREDLKSAMRDKALAQIVEMRAERNTPKAPAPKPVRGKKKS